MNRVDSEALKRARALLRALALLRRSAQRTRDRCALIGSKPINQAVTSAVASVQVRGAGPRCCQHPDPT
jgi:hypothetical protein